MGLIEVCPNTFVHSLYHLLLLQLHYYCIFVFLLAVLVTIHMPGYAYCIENKKRVSYMIIHALNKPSHLGHIVRLHFKNSTDVKYILTSRHCFL